MKDKYMGGMQEEECARNKINSWESVRPEFETGKDMYKTKAKGPNVTKLNKYYIKFTCA